VRTQFKGLCHKTEIRACRSFGVETKLSKTKANLFSQKQNRGVYFASMQNSRFLMQNKNEKKQIKAEKAKQMKQN
jgi:hypothetical protein